MMIYAFERVQLFKEMSKRCPQKQLNDYIDKIIKEGTKELTHKLKNEAQKRNLYLKKVEFQKKVEIPRKYSII